MVKYETTLEEAKKIKELGFDFSPACEKFESELVPIVPYPILEACLPVIRTRAPFNGFVDSSVRAVFFGTYQMIDEQIDDYSCLDDYILNDFENVYEAFIWCAENYLEETKKRFNEVIDQIREGLDNREEDCSNSKGGKNELY